MFKKFFKDQGNVSAVKNLLVVALTTLFFGCKAQQTQRREVGTFNKIQVSGSAYIVYTQSDTASVIVKANANEIDRVQTTVENSVLIITNKGNFTDPVEIQISHNKLTAIDASGAASFKSTNEISGDSLALELTGSANVKVSVRVRSVRCQQSGASSAVLRGTSD